MSFESAGAALSLPVEPGGSLPRKIICKAMQGVKACCAKRGGLCVDVDIIDCPSRIPPAVVQFLPFVLIIVVFYFLLIRPNQRKQQTCSRC